MDQPTLTRANDFEVESHPWGKLLWGVSGALHNSAQLTLGWCVLEPGQGNGRHYHPNCDEVLLVVEGRIVHSWNSEEVEMAEGDVIVLRQGVIHSARNIGEGPTRLMICFSSADRQTVSVEEEG